ncbi:hypothetical protein [Effusibacillus lacus]|uniref:Uncharacterized protein n=1 Tax=Effusibacillus lacus TaxID=1348429 RepID=A0A292YN32_9BACL|nr:hypothetical protein [Effusibacillus lacus]TCS73195.1 hypothetical protein EDD64_11974 [Effusibacillus lacus]GAX90596.1 hypothetical protein EFBL_2223 [Effusibacillus lacus]
MKKNKQSVPLQLIYTVFVEEPNDFYFHPRGVLFVDKEHNHTLFCSDVDYNFLLRAIRKFPYKELELGVEFNGHQFELKNITAEMTSKYGDAPKAMKEILKDLYQTSPRQYSFLRKVFEQDSAVSHFTP